MALDTTAGVPCKIQAGDARSFYVLDSLHPASSWTSRIYFTRNGVPITNASGSANGNFHDFTLNAATTNALMGTTGQYSVQWFIRYTESANSSNVETGSRGAMTVIPNLAVTQTKSPAAQMLDAIDAALLTLASDPYASVSFSGQSYSNNNRADLLAFRTQVAAQVHRENIALATAMGEPDGSVYQTRFQR